MDKHVSIISKFLSAKTLLHDSTIRDFVSYKLVDQQLFCN